MKRDAVIDDVELLTWGLYQTSKVTTSDEVAAAWEFNQGVAAEMARFHQEYPIFLTPTTAWTAPEIGNPLISETYQQQLTEIEHLAGPERKQLIYDQWLEALTLTPYTQQANLTGQPALSLPTYLSPAGLPLGIQLTGAQDQDLTLLALGQLFEGQKQFKMLHPLDTGEPTEPTEPSQSTSESDRPESTPSSSEPSQSISESRATELTSSSSELSKPNVSKTTSSQVTSKSSLKKQGNQSPKAKLPQTDEQSPGLVSLLGLSLSGSIFVVLRRKSKSQN